MLCCYYPLYVGLKWYWKWQGERERESSKCSHNECRCLHTTVKSAHKHIQTESDWMLIFEVSIYCSVKQTLSAMKHRDFLTIICVVYWNALTNKICYLRVRRKKQTAFPLSFFLSGTVWLLLLLCLSTLLLLWCLQLFGQKKPFIRFYPIQSFLWVLSLIFFPYLFRPSITHKMQCAWNWTHINEVCVHVVRAVNYIFFMHANTKIEC